MTARNVTENDLQSFATKLDDFGNGLPPNEQAILAEILAVAAATSENDVEGHFFVSPGEMSVLVQHLTTAGWQDVLAQQLHQVVQHIHHAAPHTLPGVISGQPGSHFQPR